MRSAASSIVAEQQAQVKATVARFTHLGPLTKKWNATADPLVADLNDPSVDVETFLQRHQPSLMTLVQIANETRDAIRPSGMPNDLLGQVVDAYGDEAAGLTDAFGALRSRDQASYEAAVQRVHAAATHKLELVCQFIAQLRHDVDLACADVTEFDTTVEQSGLDSVAHCPAR